MIGLIGLSLVFWIAFALRLMRAREPLIPLPLFANQGGAHGRARGGFRHGGVHWSDDLHAGLL